MLNCKKTQEIENKNSSSPEIITDKTAALDLGCYVYADNKNTISLEITKIGKETKGI